MSGTDTPMMTVDEAGRRLGVSVSTVWRMIRCGALRSVRRRGRRLIPEDAIARGAASRRGGEAPPFTADHPIFRLVGSGRGGGRSPGARDKHGVLDR